MVTLQLPLFQKVQQCLNDGIASGNSIVLVLSKLYVTLKEHFQGLYTEILFYTHSNVDKCSETHSLSGPGSKLLLTFSHRVQIIELTIIIVFD